MSEYVARLLMSTLSCWGACALSSKAKIFSAPRGLVQTIEMGSSAWGQFFGGDLQKARLPTVPNDERVGFALASRLLLTKRMTKRMPRSAGRLHLSAGAVPAGSVHYCCLCQ